jgi:hypothetical protein
MKRNEFRQLLKTLIKEELLKENVPELITNKIATYEGGMSNGMADGKGKLTFLATQNKVSLSKLRPNVTINVSKGDYVVGVFVKGDLNWGHHHKVDGSKTPINIGNVSQSKDSAPKDTVINEDVKPILIKAQGNVRVSSKDITGLSTSTTLKPTDQVYVLDANSKAMVRQDVIVTTLSKGTYTYNEIQKLLDQKKASGYNPNPNYTSIR